MARLTDAERQDILRHLDADQPLPDKYRFLLFEDKREVEMVWNDKSGEVSNVVLPFQTIEQVDEPRIGVGSRTSDQDQVGEPSVQGSLFDARGRQLGGWSNKLIWGDNKLILSSLKNGPMRQEIEGQGGLKLIYIDPPFDVGADFSMNVAVGDEGEELTKDPNVLEELAYRDTWGRGQDSYISMIYERLQLMRDLLAEDGSIYVHCGIQVNHLIRSVLVEIFGGNNLVSEIIWAYGSPSGGRAAGTKLVKIHEYILHFAKDYSKRKENKVHLPYSEEYIKRWFRYQDDDGRQYQRRMRGKDEQGNSRWEKQYLDESLGVPASTVWSDIKQVYADPRAYKANQEAHSEILGYPTQKPEALLERVITASSDEGDLVADFFCGSGTTAAVAENLGRKWIVADLGKFAIHTTRKRMIGVQRQRKEREEDYRSFEILNLGRYERQHFVGVNPNLRDEEQQQQLEAKEQEFLTLILNAYKAEATDNFPPFHGRRADRMVVVGPVNLPVTRLFVEEIVLQARQKNISKVDILGFEFEMGLFPNSLDDARAKGVDVAPKYIPATVFDKRAVERNQVVFHDVAYIEAKVHVRDDEVAVELTNFSVYYQQDSVAQAEDALGRRAGKKIVVERGQVVKVSKSREGVYERKVLTESWTDWIDYWSVDFDFESKQEIIRVEDPATGEWQEKWTGDYIFENEWQSFRTRKSRALELKSAFHPCKAGRRKVAVKVVDIFGNDTMALLEVSI